MSAKIEKIVLKLGAKKIELSPEEAKELKSILEELFGKDKVQYVPQPYPVYPSPWRYHSWGTPTWDTFGTTVTYSSTNMIQ